MGVAGDHLSVCSYFSAACYGRYHFDSSLEVKGTKPQCLVLS